MDQRVQNAIARIEVASDGTVISQGTASLVGANLVLTALHVVAERGTNPLRFLHGEISLRFPNQLPVQVTVHDWKWDAGEDWALLTCTTELPETIRPLPLAKIERDGDNWETHGFPDAKPDGLTVGGIVRNSHGNVHGHRAYQLLCDEAGAGQGLRVSGLSGAPVIIDKSVVGVMRWAMLTDERDEGGTLYACPASLIAVRCPDHFPEVKTVSSAPPAPMTASRKWLAAGAALALSLVAYGGVSNLAEPIRPPSSPGSPPDHGGPPAGEPAPAPKQGHAAPPNVAPPQDGKRKAARGPRSPTAIDPNPRDVEGSSAPEPDPQVAIAKAQLIRQLNDLQVRKDGIVPGLDALRKRQSAHGFGLRSDMASAEGRMMRSLSAADAEIGRPNINLETVKLSLRDAENAIKTLEDFLGVVR